jgi:hypothetical protein
MNVLSKYRMRVLALAVMGATMGLANAASLSSATYGAAKDQLQASYKAERETCNSMSGNAKDICVETAKGREKVAMAHLQHQRSGDTKDMAKLAEVRYDARYELAKEVCDDQAGNAKDVCVAQAKAEHDKAKADMKMNKEVAKARADAADDKMAADYKVASERCDAMSGEGKDACMATARARFNQ